MDFEKCGGTASCNCFGHVWTLARCLLDIRAVLLQLARPVLYFFFRPMCFSHIELEFAQVGGNSADVSAHVTVQQGWNAFVLHQGFTESFIQSCRSPNGFGVVFATQQQDKDSPSQKRFSQPRPKSSWLPFVPASELAQLRASCSGFQHESSGKIHITQDFVRMLTHRSADEKHRACKCLLACEKPLGDYISFDKACGVGL